MSPLLQAAERFYQTLDATTLRVDGGRMVDGVADAIVLSAATDALYAAMAVAYSRLFQEHGLHPSQLPPDVKIELTESDSPDGPFTQIPAADIRMSSCAVEDDPVLCAALFKAAKAIGFPAVKWNALQAARPGANHRRWEPGDLVTDPQLLAVESAVKLVRLKESYPTTGGRTNPQAPDDAEPADYIDLDQAAALVNRSKKTLERALADGKMPPPDIEGGGGKKHEWIYGKLRPWLENEYGKKLPPRPPHAMR